MRAGGLVEVKGLPRTSISIRSQLQKRPGIDNVTFSTAISRSSRSVLSGVMPWSRRRLLRRCRSKPFAALSARNTSSESLLSLSCGLTWAERFLFGIFGGKGALYQVDFLRFCVKSENQVHDNDKFWTVGMQRSDYCTISCVPVAIIQCEANPPFDLPEPTRRWWGSTDAGPDGRLGSSGAHS